MSEKFAPRRRASSGRVEVRVVRHAGRDIRLRDALWRCRRRAAVCSCRLEKVCRGRSCASSSGHGLAATASGIVAGTVKDIAAKREQKSHAQRLARARAARCCRRGRAGALSRKPQRPSTGSSKAGDTWQESSECARKRATPNSKRATSARPFDSYYATPRATSVMIHHCEATRHTHGRAPTFTPRLQRLWAVPAGRARRVVSR